MVKIVKQNLDDITMYGYYDSNGNFVLHHENGPAIIYEDGEIRYAYHNKLHRIGGPAIIDAHCHIYMVYDNVFTNEVNEWLDERDLNIDNLGNEDYLALCMFMESLNG